MFKNNNTKYYNYFINGQTYTMHKKALVGVINQANELFKKNNQHAIICVLKGNVALARKMICETEELLDFHTNEYIKNGFIVINTKVNVEEFFNAKDR